MVKRKRTKGQTMIYKTLHRKLQIEQHESHKNVVPEGLSASGINVREYRWGTSRMKIKRHSENWAEDTERRQTKRKYTTQNTLQMKSRPNNWNLKGERSLQNSNWTEFNQFETFMETTKNVYCNLYLSQNCTFSSQKNVTSTVSYTTSIHCILFKEKNS